MSQSVSLLVDWMKGILLDYDLRPLRRLPRQRRRLPLFLIISDLLLVMDVFTTGSSIP